MDLRNPWIVLRKILIDTLHNKVWICCAFHGLPSYYAQSMDLHNPRIVLPLFMMYICQAFCVVFGSSDAQLIVMRLLSQGVDKLDSTVLLLDISLSTTGVVSCVM